MKRIFIAIVFFIITVFTAYSNNISDELKKYIGKNVVIYLKNNADPIRRNIWSTNYLVLEDVNEKFAIFITKTISKKEEKVNERLFIDVNEIAGFALIDE